MSPRGHLALVLHAHLPFVRHPEHAHFLEEHWLFEAITDCYLPLLSVLRDAASRGSRFRLSLSLSPTLLSMVADPLLRLRYLEYLDRLERLCVREANRLRADAARRSLARYYHRRLLRLRSFYLDELGGDLIAAWSGLEGNGTVELMTTAATHGYLPLLRDVPTAAKAQLRVGADQFAGNFGHRPDGIWLPECGYYPGLERTVGSAGFRWFLLDAHGLQQARPSPPQGVYAPVSSEGIAVFGRDPLSVREVWSRERGFPGHPLYREYHRDLGLEDGGSGLGDFLPPGVEKAPTGIKYFRVTGTTEHKALYEPAAALRQAQLDAGRFLEARRRFLARLTGCPHPPVMVAAFDAELFGHWWFEGPAFLEAVIRRLDAGEGPDPVTLGEYLARHGTAAVAQPAASSWGEGGYNEAWLRPETGWVYLQLQQAGAELQGLVRQHLSRTGDERAGRVLRQAARSLLLAQSSDWTFHLGRAGATDYARTRLRDQLARVRYLVQALRAGEVCERRLGVLERMDNLFPDLDLAHFS